MKTKNLMEPDMPQLDVSGKDESERDTENQADLYVIQHGDATVGKATKNATEKVVLHPKSCDVNVKYEGGIKTEVSSLQSLQVTQSEELCLVNKSDDGCEMWDDEFLPSLKTETGSQMAEVVETGHCVSEDDSAGLGEMTLESGDHTGFCIKTDVDESTQKSISFELSDQESVDNCEKLSEKHLFCPTQKTFQRECNTSIATRSAFGEYIPMLTDDKSVGIAVGEKSCEDTSRFEIHSTIEDVGSRPYNCVTCEQFFYEEKTLLEHTKTHTEERPYTYVAFEKSCYSKSHLTTHTEGIHSGEEPYQCDTLGIAYSHNSDLLMHTKTHIEEKPHKCVTCEKSFSRKSCLLRHTKTHTGEKPYKCVTCEKSFSLKSNLLQHTKTHTGERPFKCGPCEKSFIHKSALLSHIKTHTGERPYKCVICEKSFSEKSVLLRHTKTHTGERPYKCDICQKSFSRESHLLSHTRTHTGERPYKCGTCEKSFSKESNLLRHTRTHTGERPYKCAFCERCFSQESNLLSHTRTHTGEKPYKCVTCEKSFTDQSNFLTHRRTHTGERPYTCVTCGKCFSHKSTLSKHTRTHTGSV